MIINGANGSTIKHILIVPRAGIAERNRIRCDIVVTFIYGEKWRYENQDIEYIATTVDGKKATKIFGVRVHTVDGRYFDISGEDSQWSINMLFTHYNIQRKDEND